MAVATSGAFWVDLLSSWTTGRWMMYTFSHRRNHLSSELQAVAVGVFYSWEAVCYIISGAGEQLDQSIPKFEEKIDR